MRSLSDERVAYVVDTRLRTCTCPSFLRRRKVGQAWLPARVDLARDDAERPCKHIDLVEAAENALVAAKAEYDFWHDLLTPTPVARPVERTA